MCDSMGLEEGSAGLSMKEIDDILEGKVKDGAKVRITYSVKSFILICLWLYVYTFALSGEFQWLLNWDFKQR